MIIYFCKLRSIAVHNMLQVIFLSDAFCVWVWVRVLVCARVRACVVDLHQVIHLGEQVAVGPGRLVLILLAQAQQIPVQVCECVRLACARLVRERKAEGGRGSGGGACQCEGYWSETSHVQGEGKICWKLSDESIHTSLP